MRLVGAIPELERFTVLALAKKLFEVPGVIRIRYALLGFLVQLYVIIFNTGRILLAATREPGPWSPTLTCEADFVARRFQQIDKSLVLDRK